MLARGRIVGFGGAVALVAAGIVCAAAIGGVTGDAVAVGLVAVGFVLAASLAFLEIGLAEDRERARATTPAEPARGPREHPADPHAEERRVSRALWASRMRRSRR